MADKTTTLKTKTNDNVYPNVIGDNRKNAFVDSSTITHHFYDKTHKVGFQIANETNIKIQNSLQKPAGLTKTKLVGVGTNGQENIEIGDNLTLEGGKLSANAVENVFDVITLTDAYANSFTGTITGTKPILITSYDGKYSSLYPQDIHKNKYVVATLDIKHGKIIKKRFFGVVTSDKSEYLYYSHFITMTDSSSNVALYLTIQNTDETELTADTLASYLSGKKVLANGNLHGVVPTYIAGEGGIIKIYYRTPGDSNINPTPDEYQDLSSFTITDLVTPVE